MAKTVLDLLQLSSDYLTKHGIDNARLDAELLLSHALGCKRIDLYVAFDRPLDEEETGVFREYTRRRKSGEPVQYIVGEQEFWSLPFTVRSGVLIPRPETELLVEEAAAVLKAAEEAPAALDLCTGSGCVAVALAHEVPESQVIASDISEAAVAVARENAERNAVNERLSVHLGDLFGALPGESGPFDAITANAPYVTSAECETLMREVREHEPRVALDGGKDGLDLVRRIVAEAPRYLKPGGMLALELGIHQPPAVRDLIAADERYAEVRIRADYSKIERCVIARLA